MDFCAWDLLDSFWWFSTCMGENWYQEKHTHTHTHYGLKKIVLCLHRTRDGLVHIPTNLDVVVVHLLFLTLCNPMDCSMPGSSVLFYLPECAETHVHWVGDAIQPSHPLSPPSLLALNLSQHQGLFQWVCSSYQVAKVLELQLQHQSFQWIFRVDFL